MDKKNGNHLWVDWVKLEIDQQRQCGTYKNMGTGQAPKERKKTRAHFVFDVKHDSRQKCGLVAYVNLTDAPLSHSSMIISNLRHTVNIKLRWKRTSYCKEED